MGLRLLGAMGFAFLLCSGPPAIAAPMVKVGVVFWHAPVPGSVPSAESAVWAATLRASLASRGWMEGRNIEILWASSERSAERMGELLDRFVAMPVDLIVVTGNLGAAEARKRTRRIPIVTTFMQTPVEIGLVDSVARPGGNLTGMIGFEGATLYAKRLSLLKEADPRVSRVAFMTTFEPVNGWEYAKGIVQMARRMDMSIWPVSLEGPKDLERAFADAVREGANGIFMDHEISKSREHQAAINALAKRHKLPIVYPFSFAATFGGLIAYYEDPREAWTRTAHFIDRILKGARPGDLPLEKPERMRLVINAGAARDIGVVIPKSLLLRADEVID